MGYKTGIGFFDSIISQNSKGGSKEDLKELIISGRVTNINLNSNSTIFSTTDEWQGVGTIQFQPVGGPVNEQTLNSSGLNYAKPLFAQIKNYPLVNEIVILFKLPSRQGISDLSNTEEYYYLNTIGIWNHPHVNAYPNPLNSPSATPTTNKSILEILAGNPSKTTDESTDLDLNGGSGGTFVESSIIHPLVPFAGDQILEGRFGNSIRLGNTSKIEASVTNNWSEVGSSGNPITILRNGQNPEVEPPSWKPITENINQDLSSIYLTSNQQIPINTGFKDQSYSNPPVIPTEYNQNQIILNSGRLVFNANSDSILVSSEKNIDIGANDEIAISANNSLQFQSQRILLGGKGAKQSLVLGNDFMEQFELLVQNVKNISEALSESQIWPGGAPAPHPTIPPIASTVSSQMEKMLKVLNKNELLSKVSKTI
jgi:hypothetical protein